MCCWCVPSVLPMRCAFLTALVVGVKRRKPLGVFGEKRESKLSGTVGASFEGVLMKSGSLVSLPSIMKYGVGERELVNAAAGNEDEVTGGGIPNECEATA